MIAGVVFLVALSDGGAARARAGAGLFSPLIKMIMGQLATSRLTAVPLRAPVGLLAPLSVETARGLGGWFQAGPSSYLVHVGLCPDLNPPPPVHRAVAPSKRCGGLIAELVTGFSYGARRYPSRTAARAALSLPGPGGRRFRVALGHGVSGEGHPRGGGLIDWSARGWRLRVDYSACFATEVGGDTFAHLTLPTAKRIVAFLRAHPLPRDRGRVLLSGSCGDSFSSSARLGWAAGRDVYSASAFGYDPLPSLRLAEAMRPYPPARTERQLQPARV